MSLYRIGASRSHINYFLTYYCATCVLIEMRLYRLETAVMAQTTAQISIHTRLHK